MVLVASKAAVARSLEDPRGVYSMCRHMDRMKSSFGEIFLGMDKNDPTTDYALKSAANIPISAISEQEAFAVAREAANTYLQFLQGQASALPRPVLVYRREEGGNRSAAGVHHHGPCRDLQIFLRYSGRSASRAEPVCRSARLGLGAARCGAW